MAGINIRITGAGLRAQDVKRASWQAVQLARVAEHARRISVQLRRLERVKQFTPAQLERWVFLCNQGGALEEPARLCHGLAIEENGRPFRP